ncbi:MAG: hypothetical protein L3J82_06370 [Planctomycetes bacterium]|nr:hypothetical protein [Planctomycetota bacterium]
MERTPKRISEANERRTAFSFLRCFASSFMQFAVKTPRLRASARIVFPTILVSLLLASCNYTPRLYERPNPYVEPEITRVAIAPFLYSQSALELSYDFDLTGFDDGQGSYVMYSNDIGQQFAQEFTQFDGFEIVPPREVVSAWKNSIRQGEEHNPLLSAASARAIARVLKCDAIVVGEIRSFEGYEYPRLELHWQLLYSGKRQAGSSDIKDLERRGRGGMFPVGREAANVPLYIGNEVIDSNNAETRKQLQYYGKGLTIDYTGFESGEDMVRHKAWPLYFRFASWLALQRAFEYEDKR